MGACGPGERGAVAGHGPVGSGEAGPREKSYSENHGWVKGCLNMCVKAGFQNRGVNEGSKAAMLNELK